MEPTVVSLFTGAFGLDLGLEQAGFNVRACVEKDPTAVQTIIANRPGLRDCILNKDIRGVNVKEILTIAGLEKGQVAVVSGGPPCQPFSTVGRRQSISSEEGLLFKNFLDIVWGIRPEFFIFENVRGILSAAKKHRPLEKRRTQGAGLSEDERLGSAWDAIMAEFNLTLSNKGKDSYRIHMWELNAADYGAPQLRKRVFIVGAKKGYDLAKPKARYYNNHLPLKKAIRRLRGLREREHVDYLPYDDTRHEIFSKGLVGPGENWKALPVRLQKKVMGKGWHATGGKVGFCRRLSWDKPSPTILTTPSGRATNLCHPDKPRPLTYRECALVQGFPPGWVFKGSLTQKYKQIGNAVPVKLANAIGKSILHSM
ncbi:MAG: DNA cytosine methyltransferase [Candidatus Altiarchaeota archaeon]